jgi:hypothetical protein
MPYTVSFFYTKKKIVFLFYLEEGCCTCSSSVYLSWFQVVDVAMVCFFPSLSLDKKKNKPKKQTNIC